MFYSEIFSEKKRKKKEFLRAKRGTIWSDQGRAVPERWMCLYVRPGRAALRANVADQIENRVSPAESAFSACSGLGSSASSLPERG